MTKTLERKTCSKSTERATYLRRSVSIRRTDKCYPRRTITKCNFDDFAAPF